MNNSLSAVWSEVEKLLNNGISVIPVRDKDVGNFVAKSPYRDWKEYQYRLISKDELFKQLDEHNTSAIATICGEISGGLEVIDIDVKNKTGADAALFTDIKNIYPDIWLKLRVHRSPSGGFHILYRVVGGPVPGSMKLAGRPATEEELQKSKTKAYYFIETRGEGGYVLAPPSLGYSVARDTPLQEITWEERCSLIELCKTYTEIIKVEPAYKASKFEDNYYDENPFKDYNSRVDPVALMGEFGWKFSKESSRFIWFTRPGKDKGISASYNREKQIFFNFTASTELDELKGYQPSSLLALFKFGGDKKKTYLWLVENGYGKVKPKKEAELVKKKILAGEPLPANFSEDARQSADRIKANLDAAHPFGVFWEVDKDEKINISRSALYDVCDGLGFKLHTGALVQIDRHLIYRRTDRFFFDAVREYIKEEDGDLYIDIFNALDAFIEKHGRYIISRLPILEDALILRDSPELCYKFFQNCFVCVTAGSITEQPYDELNGLIWAENIQPRDYTHAAPGGLYVDFIKKACVNPAAVKKVIGYLAHQWKDETTGYIIVLTEATPDPKNGGGSGKNIFSQLFQFTTTFLNIPGAQVKYDEKFLQSWGYQRVFAISDVPKKFDFGFLKELSTGSGILKKLFKDETSVPVEVMPKFLIQTNYSYEVTDGGLRRRIIPVEFTDFFTLAGGVDVHYGAHFPKGWGAADWAGYDAYVFRCVQEWLQGGRKLQAADLTDTGWRKQFEQQYGELTMEFIRENFDYWTRVQFVSNDRFNEGYTKFCVENNIGMNYRLSAQKMNRALTDYANKNNYECIPNTAVKVDGVTIRGREFLPSAPF